MLLPGVTWEVSSMTTGLWGQRSRAWGLGGVLDPAGEGQGPEEDMTDLEAASTYGEKAKQLLGFPSTLSCVSY